jgi:hypothetical protein
VQTSELDEAGVETLDKTGELKPENEPEEDVDENEAERTEVRSVVILGFGGICCCC